MANRFRTGLTATRAGRIKPAFYGSARAPFIRVWRPVAGRSAPFQEGENMDELTQQMRDRLVEILLTSSRDEAIKYLRRQGVPEDRAIVYVDDEENRLLA